MILYCSRQDVLGYTSDENVKVKHTPSGSVTPLVLVTDKRDEINQDQSETNSSNQRSSWQRIRLIQQSLAS